jgi:hypothetical protein
MRIIPPSLTFRQITYRKHPSKKKRAEVESAPCKWGTNVGFYRPNPHTKEVMERTNGLLSCIKTNTA